jgi:hypothetical protein
MWLNARKIREAWKNLQELKKLEEAKILPTSWKSLKNQSIGDLRKNVEVLKKIEELKNLRCPERKLTWLRQPVGYDRVGPNAAKNVEESKKLQHLKELEPLKILAENLQELQILLPTMNSHSSQARRLWSAAPKDNRCGASDLR